MRELVLTPRFERAFRRLVAKNPALQPHLETALRRMAADVGDPRLKTHHLSGQLKGLHACSVCGQDSSLRTGMAKSCRKRARPAMKLVKRPPSSRPSPPGEGDLFAARWQCGCAGLSDGLLDE